jgi:mono/diheme cytochrome c family protein
MNDAARVLLVGVAFALTSAFADHPAANAGADAFARGRYLVNDAGKCSVCHGRDLHGSVLALLRPGLPGIAYRAPSIAGLRQLGVADASRFLRTGLLPNGKRARRPMRQFRFAADDASAIVAYLKSLR